MAPEGDTQNILPVYSEINNLNEKSFEIQEKYLQEKGLIDGGRQFQK